MRIIDVIGCRMTSTTQQRLPKEVVLPYLIILRCINAVTINTFFQADEYWQSLEPAHALVFGYGYLTWEWREGLRSFVHPLLFAVVYKLCELLDLGEIGVVYMPKLTQGVVCAIGEWYLYKFAYSLTKNEIIARGTLFLSVISAFNWFCLTRTFSNSLELTLITASLSHWPWNSKSINWRGFGISLTLAAWSCFIRPTNGLIWLILAIQFLWKLSWTDRLQSVLFALVIGMVVGAINTVIDYLYYGELVFPMWNFIKFNALASLSRFYGVAPWHFHILQSVPLMLMLYLPFFVYGLIKAPYTGLKWIILLVLAAFSAIDHKEFRFILPLQPFMLILTAFGSYHLYLHHSTLVTNSIIGIVMVNTCISLFFTQWHESGVIKVIDYLKTDPDAQSLGFLMPCHSTPWQSHLHRPDLEAWFLTCEPPLHLLDGDNHSKHEIDAYMDESDYFYDNPVKFLHENFPPPFNKKLRTPGREYKYEWPTHLVFFEALEPVMKEYLNDSPYEECTRFFNSYFHWDDRRNGDVIVYCKWPWE